MRKGRGVPRQAHAEDEGLLRQVRFGAEEGGVQELVPVYSHGAAGEKTDADGPGQEQEGDGDREHGRVLRAAAREVRTIVDVFELAELGGGPAAGDTREVRRRGRPVQDYEELSDCGVIRSEEDLIVEGGVLMIFQGVEASGADHQAPVRDG